jgi:hypothetical protein
MANKRVGPDITIESYDIIKAAAKAQDRPLYWMLSKILNDWAANHEKKSKPKVKKEVKTVGNSEVQKVIDQYCQIMGKRCQLTPKRESLINARLQDCGYNEIIQAIHGCTRSSYHMGQNERQTAYNSIEFICRSIENIEKFTQTVGVIQRETVQPNNAKLSSVQRAKQRLQARSNGQAFDGNGQVLDMDDRDLFQ